MISKSKLAFELLEMELELIPPSEIFGFIGRQIPALKVPLEL